MYIGRSSEGFGVRNTFTYVLSAGQTAITGNDVLGRTLKITNTDLTDVYLNGILLKHGASEDWTATSTTLTLVASGNASDEIFIVTYQVFSLSDALPKSNGVVENSLDMNGNELILDSDGDSSITADTDDAIDFKVAGSDVIRIDSSGNLSLGNGTNTNDGVIHINAGDGAKNIVCEGDRSTEGQGIGNVQYHSAGTNVVQISAERGSTDAKGDLALYTNGGSLTERMRITEDGDIGVGTNAPAKPIHSKGGSSNGSIRVEHTSNSLYNDLLYDGLQMNGNSFYIVPASNYQVWYEGAQPRLYLSTGGYIGLAGANGSTTASSPKSSGSYHQIKQTNNDTANIELYVANGSFTSYGTRLQCDRASGTAFMHLTRESDGSLVFKWRGDGSAFADGSYDNSGADYAEYFEWKDGNSSDEDRVGYSVALDGNQIRKATSDDEESKIIGIVSGTPAVIGDGGLAWNGKYLKDDFGRRVMEDYTITTWTEKKTNDRGDEVNERIEYHTDRIPSDVTVPSDAVVTSTTTKAKDAKIYTPNNKLQRPKLNPDYDDDQDSIDNPFKSREFRKEWSAVGLTGKLRMRKGQPTGDRWIKMRDISDTVEEWLVR